MPWIIKVYMYMVRWCRQYGYEVYKINSKTILYLGTYRYVNVNT